MYQCRRDFSPPLLICFVVLLVLTPLAANRDALFAFGPVDAFSCLSNDSTLLDVLVSALVEVLSELSQSSSQCFHALSLTDLSPTIALAALSALAAHYRRASAYLASSHRCMVSSISICSFDSLCAAVSRDPCALLVAQRTVAPPSSAERRDLPRGVHARRPAAARLALAAVPVCVCAVSCRAVGGSGWLGGCWCACSTWWWALVLNAVACSTWWRSQRGGVLNAMTCSTRLPSSSSTSRCAHGHPQRQPPAVCTPPPTPATRNGRQLHRADAAVQHGGLIGGQCCVDLRIPTPGEWKRLVVAVLVAQPEQPLK